MSDEKTVGEVLVDEIVEKREEKIRLAMKEHLSWCMERKKEMEDEKDDLCKQLDVANKNLEKVKAMSLDEFDAWQNKELKVAYKGNGVNTFTHRVNLYKQLESYTRPKL